MKLKVITPLGTFESKKINGSKEAMKVFIKEVTEQGTRFNMEIENSEVFISGEMIKQSIFVLED